jgi:hypothetical protein
MNVTLVLGLWKISLLQTANGDPQSSNFSTNSNPNPSLETRNEGQESKEQDWTAHT